MNLTALETQVGDDLAQAAAVAAHDGRDVVVDERRQLEPLAVRLRREHLARVLDRLAQVEVVRVELELAGLDLREVEDVVDDAEQRLARARRRSARTRAARRRARSASSSSVIPITPLSGVRISWLMLARNSDFERDASTASASARLRSVTSVAIVATA